MRGRKVNNNAQHNLRILPLKHSNDENTRRVSALYNHEEEEEGDSTRAAHLLVILYVSLLLLLSLFLLFLCSFSLYLLFAQVFVCAYLWRTRTNDLIPVVVSNCK